MDGIVATIRRQTLDWDGDENGYDDVAEVPEVLEEVELPLGAGEIHDLLVLAEHATPAPMPRGTRYRYRYAAGDGMAVLRSAGGLWTLTF